MRQAVYHNPPHIYIDNTVYITTASTIHKQKYFNTDTKKQILRKTIFKTIKELRYNIFAWVIFADHYHILFEVVRSRFLAKLMNLINGRSSYMLNRLEKQSGRRIWYSYWDTCIRNADDFYTRFNYIHNNPIKHKYINKLDELPFYNYSSYSYYLKTKGQEWINDILMRYPIIDCVEKYDDY